MVPESAIVTTSPTSKFSPPVKMVTSYSTTEPLPAPTFETTTRTVAPVPDESPSTPEISIAPLLTPVALELSICELDMIPRAVVPSLASSALLLAGL